MHRLTLLVPIAAALLGTGCTSDRPLDFSLTAGIDVTTAGSGADRVEIPSGLGREDRPEMGPGRVVELRIGGSFNVEAPAHGTRPVRSRLGFSVRTRL